MSSTQKPADVMAERRSHWWWTVPGWALLQIVGGDKLIIPFC
ncbi:hypothetical protein U9240_24580 [Escherichia coli]